jgi:hypothetical protein
MSHRTVSSPAIFPDAPLAASAPLHQSSSFCSERHSVGGGRAVAPFPFRRVSSVAAESLGVRSVVARRATHELRCGNGPLSGGFSHAIWGHQSARDSTHRIDEIPPAVRTSLKPALSVARGMPARCERCGAETEQVWEHHSNDGPEWLCQECHPEMTSLDR